VSGQAPRAEEVERERGSREARDETYGYQQEDAAKVVEAYKATGVEEFRVMLRQEYLIQLLTMQEVEGFPPQSHSLRRARCPADHELTTC